MDNEHHQCLLVLSSISSFIIIVRLAVRRLFCQALVEALQVLVHFVFFFGREHMFSRMLLGHLQSN